MPLIKTTENSIDARQRKFALLEAMGMRARDQAQSLGLGQTSSLVSIRRGAYEKGYVRELQEGRKGNVISLVEERERLAQKCYNIMNQTAERITDKYELEPEEGELPYLNLSEAEMCRKMVETTEFTGKKQEAPQVEINVRKELTVNIQNTVAEIQGLLGDVDLEALEPSCETTQADV